MNASPAIPDVIFSNPAPITIPGGPAPGSPYPSNISATGVTGAVTKVTVTLTGMTHTWPDDIGVLVVGPTGVKVRLMIDSGFNFEINGVNLTFDDAAAGTLPNSGQIVSGTFRPSSGTAGPGEGAAHPANFPAPAPPGPYSTTLASFNGVNPNGTWALFVDDDASGDSGAISGGWSINITADTPVVPGDANVDLNGDGKTDYTITRGTDTPLTEATAPALLAPRRFIDSSTEIKGRNRDRVDSGLSSPITWYTVFNGTSSTLIAQLGDAGTDVLTPEDFDGDGKDDMAVWTEASPGLAGFKILQSSNATVRTEPFGIPGDDPAIVGDYDGDNKADLAVYRCPSTPGQCFFFYKGSLNNPSGNITFVPWGFGAIEDLFPAVGDFDGDGKHDFCVQRSDPAAPANGQFVLLKSAGGTEFINWGFITDFVIPGDYDADGKSDFMVRRTVGGVRQHWLLERDGGTSATVFGLAGDASTPGDYDGDGKTDIAIWRGNTVASQNFFWVLNSSNGSVSTFQMGQCPTPLTCDMPAAGWAVH